MASPFYWPVLVPCALRAPAPVNLGVRPAIGKNTVKLGNLKSLGHNVADSVASGIGLLVGVYTMNVFAEAESEEPGYIEIDFLEATTSGVPSSSSLRQAIALYRKALPELATKHGIDAREIQTLSARFGTDKVYGPHFTVTVASKDGRRSTDRYVGVPGKRMNTKEAKS
jgi:hypothetical protein